MNYLEPELLEGLARRFVLGTMPLRSRRRFSRIVDENPAAAAKVHELEAMLLPAAWSLPPARPSDLVWQRVARQAGLGKHARPGTDGQLRSRVAWPAVSGALVVALLATTVGWWQEWQRPPETIMRTVVEPVPVEPAVGIVTSDDGSAIWVARIYADLGRADIAISTAPEPQAAKDYQLWILKDDGVPVSLGLLPQSGRSSLQLDPAAVDALALGSTLAVSLEPLGGSPEPAPTGPVLFTAALLAP